jgi:DNA adenine methylase
MKVKTCLRYPGGKYYGLKFILPYLKINHKEYRETMIGGGSVFLGKDHVKVNWINDVDSELINFYKIIQNEDTKKQLYVLLKNQIASKERHKEVKQLETKDKVERAFKYFYLNRTSFSGIMVNPRWGYLIGSSVTPDRWTKIIEPVSQKLEKTKITNFDFKKIINTKSKFSSDEVLLYIDPPYFDASKNIYNNQFTKKDHIELCKILKKSKFKFILSYDNFDEIIEMYNWANIDKSNWTYFMSENRRQVGRELIISNFEVNQKLDESIPTLIKN